MSIELNWAGFYRCSAKRLHWGKVQALGKIEDITQSIRPLSCQKPAQDTIMLSIHILENIVDTRLDRSRWGDSRPRSAWQNCDTVTSWWPRRRHSLQDFRVPAFPAEHTHRVW